MEEIDPVKAKIAAVKAARAAKLAEEAAAAAPAAEDAAAAAPEAAAARRRLSRRTQSTSNPRDLLGCATRLA